MALSEVDLTTICPHGREYQDCADPDCTDVLDRIEDEDDNGEWQPDRGECDRCFGGDEDGVTATGPLGPLYCACRIGQGASEEDCVCGPEDEEA